MLNKEELGELVIELTAIHKLHMSEETELNSKGIERGNEIIAIFKEQELVYGWGSFAEGMDVIGEGAYLRRKADYSEYLSVNCSLSDIKEKIEAFTKIYEETKG